MISLPKTIFVSGTDTGIGKTLVSAMLMSALDASYWKPIQSGLEEETDSEFIKRVTEADDEKIIPERFRLNEPMSPHAAADIDGVNIDLADFNVPEFHTSNLIVEGAGGLWVPINWHQNMMDLIEHLSVPVLLVARSGLGTLNHTLLSIEALLHRNIEIIGVILNGPHHPSNKKTIEHFGKTDVWQLEHLQEISSESLIQSFNAL